MIQSTSTVENKGDFMMKPGLLIGVLLLCLPASAFASGMMLHIWMGDHAADMVSDPELQLLLGAEQSSYRSGCVYPDSGYAVPDRHWGEFSHWGGFLNSYARYISRTCQYPFTGNCRTLVAHYLGTLCHSLGDVNFDRYFVRQVANQTFQGSLSRAQDFTDKGLDFIAVMEERRGKQFKWQWAPVDDLVNIYEDSGHGVSKDEIVKGVQIHNLANLGIRLVAPLTWLFYKQQSPWAVENYLTARGGVFDTGSEIARAWDQAWTFLKNSGHSAEYPEIGFSGSWPDISYVIASGFQEDRSAD